MSVAGSATEQISKHLQYASQPPFTVLIQIPKNIKMTDKFRGRKLFVTNCATEHSHYTHHRHIRLEPPFKNEK